MPNPIRPNAFSVACSPDWTGGFIASSMNGSGLDVVLATSACKIISIKPQAESGAASCLMSDELNQNLAPRDGSEFLKIRVCDEYVSKLIDNPLQAGFTTEVKDCFIVLNIVGVSGTYAVRLKNENNSEFSPWIAVGQPMSGTDADASLLFKPRFVAQDEFEVPWLLSPGDGVKTVTAEILSYFGKSQPISIDIKASYEIPEYSAYIKLVLTVPSDSGGGVLEVDPPSYNGYSVIGSRALLMPDDTVATKDDIDALDVATATNISKIRVYFKFKNPQRISRIMDLISANLAFSASDDASMKAVMITRGVNKIEVDLVPVEEQNGLYRGEFNPFISDNILIKDGIAAFYPYVPSECILSQDDFINLAVEGIDFAGLGDNMPVSDTDRSPVFKGFVDPKDLKNSFADIRYWRDRL